jgi:nitrogen-specific signal transduction histidine kinase
MVFGIIKRHQATLEIDSEPDQGTTFRIRLPACVQPLAEPQHDAVRLASVARAAAA